MFSFLAARMAVRRRGLESGSPPPTRAAMVISRISLVKMRPRLASVAAFLCLIVAHLECPDMIIASWETSWGTNPCLLRRQFSIGNSESEQWHGKLCASQINLRAFLRPCSLKIGAAAEDQHNVIKHGSADRDAARRMPGQPARNPFW